MEGEGKGEGGNQLGEQMETGRLVREISTNYAFTLTAPVIQFNKSLLSPGRNSFVASEIITK